jgi:hypothetical protein
MLALRVAASRGIDVIDLGTGQARALTTAPGFAPQLIWRADGQAVRYTFNDSINFSVRETTLAGADREVRVMGRVHANMGVVFADYNRAVTGLASANNTRRLIDLTSGAERVLDVPTMGRKPNVSPDGRWLAVTISTSTPQYQDALRVVSLETGEGRTIPLGFNDADNRLMSKGPVWHPDSKRVFLLGVPPNSSSEQRVYSVSLNGEGIRQLTTPVPGSFARTIGVSPDGRTLVYSLNGAPKARLVEFDLAPLINAATPVRR